MTWTVTARGADSSGGFTASFTMASASWTPTEGNVIAVAIYTGSTTASLTSVTGFSNTTFSEILTVSNFHVWAAEVGASPGNSTLTINGPSDTYGAAVIEIATSNGFPSGIANIFPSNNATLNQYNPSSPLAFPSLSAFGQSSNLSLNVGASAVGADQFAADTGDGFSASESLSTDDSIFWFYKTSADTSHNLVEGTTSFSFKTILGMAFEVAEASGVSGNLNLLLMGVG